MLRPIIEIDEEKCNGCGQCVLDCAEGALAIVDGKARLIGDMYCDGLGACLNCPQGALTLNTREAAPFDEAAALAARARREASGAASGGCPGSAARALRPLMPHGGERSHAAAQEGALAAQLPAWPVKLALVPPAAPFLRGARLLLTADCASLALPDLHAHWLTGHIPLLACPKLEDHAALRERLGAIIREAAPAGITILRMSVPCCGALGRLAEQAMAACGGNVPLATHTVRLP
ncbi:ATP-binding protein [uncultured Desulfovibrio sp.]|uniref:ATP-binding protein n=5 Tax=uncultured Desulfovibrio sp. TaxID=167968 RepID=UPI0025D7F8C5|nr:4Fe-4S binding protein [uncultured Desulfovibrio sp.]